VFIRTRFSLTNLREQGVISRGCSGISVLQVVLYAKAAQKAGADCIISMAPARTDQAIAIDMYKRISLVYSD
jgi:hypothetical protein